MPWSADQLDLTRAVVAWKVLWLEARTNQDRYDLVWQPTQRLLDSLSVHPLATFNCFAGKNYMFPTDSDGVAVNLFFVGHNRVAYLGTLLDQTANETDRRREIARLAILNKHLSQKLRSTDRRAIVHDSLFCKIPVESDSLDAGTATEAVKRYLAVRAPQLLGREIDWLPHEDGIALEQQIRTEAERTAQRPTKNERWRSIVEDELELW